MPKPNYPEQESLLPHPVPRDFLDCTYLTADGVELGLRIWSPANSSSSSPWLFWTHGGAFLTGAHYAPPSWVIPAFRSLGYHIVSVAYRFAPAVDLRGILSDCCYAFQWCRKNLPLILGNDIDLESFAIGGDSAGGTITTLLGHVLRPRPRAVIDVYGVVDFLDFEKASLGQVAKDDTWRTRWGAKYSAEDNMAFIRNRDLSRALSVAPFGWEITHIPPEKTGLRWGIENFEYSSQMEFQTQLKDFITSERLLLSVLLRLHECDNHSVRQRLIKGWSPLHILETTLEYPPTAFLHGEEDTIPIKQSQRMAEMLRSRGTAVYESYEPLVPHAFDQLYTGPEVKGWELYIAPLVHWVDSRVRGKVENVA